MRCDFGLDTERKDFTSTLYLGKTQVRRVETRGCRLEGGLRETSWSLFPIVLGHC